MRAHFTVLDSWRGLAALLVAYGHLSVSGELADFVLAARPGRFVDFFFVLSGFVIAHSSGDRLANAPAEGGRFLIRRLARLWPLHVFVLSLLFIYQLVLLGANTAQIINKPLAFSDSFNLSALPSNLLLIQAWGVEPINTWNEPAWSISTELAAYLCFTLATVTFGRRAWLVLSAVGIACVLYALAHPEIMRANVGLAVVRCLGGFGVGVLTYKLFTQKPERTWPAPGIVEWLVFAMVFAGVIFVTPPYAAILIPLYGLTVFVFAHELGYLSRMLTQRPFVYLGERSYSIYLVHAVIAIGIYSVAALAGLMAGVAGESYIGLPAPFGDLLMVAFLGVTILFSSLTYRFVELPGQALGKRWLARKGTALNTMA